MRVYLDNCAFNRPFDAQRQPRVRLESEAKLHLQEKIKAGKLELVWSYILDIENDQNPFQEKRLAIARWARFAILDVSESQAIVERAKQFRELGIRAKDALHVASAIDGAADYFVTTDDKLLKKLRVVPDIIAITPIDLLAIIGEYDD